MNVIENENTGNSIKYPATGVLILAVALLGSCRYESEPVVVQKAPAIVELSTPAAPESSLPNLFATDGGNVFLTWVEEKEVGEAKLYFSSLSAAEDNFSPKKMIAEGSDWFVNWADFPAFAAIDEKRFASHYLAKNGNGTYAYGVNLVFSRDGGVTWSDRVIPHETETETEHGFVSLLPYKDGYFAAWLDGRAMDGSHGHGNGAMSIRAAFIDSNGSLTDEYLLDDRTCDCCQTSAAITDQGPIVAYRDRSEDEVRDISVVRWTGDGWTAPSNPVEDGWKIPGCPVNGPVLAANGDQVAMLWFTSPEGASNVKLAFSEDAGASFGDAILLGLGHAIGRVDMVMLDDHSVYAIWMEADGDEGKIFGVHYLKNGMKQSESLIATTSSARASGFPALAKRQNELILAWRQMGESTGVRTAKITVPATAI